MQRKVICALDTSDLKEALTAAARLRDHIGGFKIGHSLTLAHGIEVVEQFYDLGIERIFLDLKFHDIPNTVALAVREAAKHNIWMMTLHIAGGPAMISAAVEEARFYPEEKRPMLVGVSVLTSLDQNILTNFLGVDRSIEDQMVWLSRLGVDTGLDGVVCSPHEVKAVRRTLGHNGVIVVPGIRAEGAQTHDQKRVGSASSAIADGADYLVMGRTLMDAKDPVSVLSAYGLTAGV